MYLDDCWLATTDVSGLNSEFIPLGQLESRRRRSQRPSSAVAKTGSVKREVSQMRPPNDPPGETPVLSNDDIPDDEPLPLWHMKITQPAYYDTMTYLLARVPEAAGILVGPASDDSVVTRFIPDIEGHGTPVTFELNAAHLNRVLKELKPAGLGCKGLVHSHPQGIPQPSSGDVHYFQKLFGTPANVGTNYIYTPIVCDGRLFPYVFSRGRVFAASLVVI